MSRLVNVSTDKLKPGMNVQAMLKQKGTIQVKTKGGVSSSDVVAALRNKGLLIFLVVISKSKLAEEDKESAKTDRVELPTVQTADSGYGASFEDEIDRAAKLYDDAKQLQEKLLDSIKMGLPVDFEPIQEMSNKFVGSLERNPNALLCMTHLREKDAYLLEHSLNVGILMGAFASFLGFDDKVINELAFAGIVHDNGKVEIPDKVLLKPGKLTDYEMEVMQDHVTRGIEALELMPGVSDTLLEIVAQHHERLDGSGYPAGISGEEISVYGRMIGIVDSYDAMTADRCYKEGMESNQALKRLLKMANSELDKELVAKFIKHIGIHPVGSLVKLDPQKISFVTELNDAAPLSSKVKSFCSLRSKHYLESKDVDLSQKQCREKIISSLREQDLNINYKKFLHERVKGY